MLQIESFISMSRRVEYATTSYFIITLLHMHFVLIVLLYISLSTFIMTGRVMSMKMFKKKKKKSIMQVANYSCIGRKKRGQFKLTFSAALRVEWRPTWDESSFDEYTNEQTEYHSGQHDHLQMGQFDFELFSCQVMVHYFHHTKEAIQSQHSGYNVGRVDV